MNRRMEKQMKNIVLVLSLATVLLAIGCTDSKPAVIEKSELPTATSDKEPGKGAIPNLSVDGA